MFFYTILGTFQPIVTIQIAVVTVPAWLENVTAKLAGRVRDATRWIRGFTNACQDVQIMVLTTWKLLHVYARNTGLVWTVRNPAAISNADHMDHASKDAASQ